MKPDELTGLLQKFSPKVFQNTLESLRAAYQADTANPVRNVFQALEAALSAPGVTQLEPVEIPAGQASVNGRVTPASAGSWPVRIAEISGGGAPYLKVEQIRTNAFVVPLRLNTARPQFEGAALAVALLHAYGAFTKKIGRLPQRNQRFVFTACDESLEVFLERRKPFGPEVFSALELDLKSCGAGKTVPALHVDSAQFGQRSFVTEALLEFFGKETACSLEEKTGGFASLALQPFKIPFARIQGGIPADLKMIKGAGRALLRTIALLGDTDYEPALKFIRPRIRQAAAAMRANPAEARKIFSELQGRLRGFEMLLHRGPWWQNPRSTILRHRKMGYLVNDLYYPRAAYTVWLEAENRKLKALLPDGKEKASVPPSSPALSKKAKAFVPNRTFNGMLSLEQSSAEAKRRLQKLGADDPSALPAWMLAALNNASGKKTVLEIFAQLAADGFKVDLKQTFDFFILLEKVGKVTRRPIITSQQILTSLAAAGIKEGDVVMIHVGYAAYGYIEAGPKGLIDLFQQAVGPTGTVCMPTHTNNLVGNPPFDHDRTPAHTGLVPTLFSKAPGTIRGWHPTHSVAARGPLAEFLLERADAREPIFGYEGFWGRFHDANGKVIMFCNSLGSNTFLHGVDYLAGAALPDTLGHLIRNGKREEVTVPGMPFHTDSFKYIYEVLEKKKQIHSAPLGTGTVYVMNARDLMKTGLPVVRKNPLLATAPDCTCDYCEHLRKAEARRKAAIKRKR
jgi:aminoglycoside 3-N-acetyltransferase